VPLEVTFVAGPLINAFRGRTDVLTFFGDFVPLAGIPPKQVGGAWARHVEERKRELAHAQENTEADS